MRYFTGETFRNLTKNGEKIENTEFSDCVFENCRISECTFENCAFSECTFIGCTVISPHIGADVSVSLAYLKDCSIVGGKWSESLSSVFSPIDKAENCQFKYNEFLKLNFKKLDFRSSAFSGCSFNECTLAEANFALCELTETEFIGCDLRKTDFRGAYGYLINLTENRVRGAIFSAGEAARLLTAFGVKIE